MIDEDDGGGHVVEPHFKFYEEQLGFPRNHTKLTTNGNTAFRRKALGSTLNTRAFAHSCAHLRVHFAARLAEDAPPSLRIVGLFDGFGGLLVALVRAGLGGKLSHYVSCEIDEKRNRVLSNTVRKWKREAKACGDTIKINGEGPFAFNPDLTLVQLFFKESKGDITKLATLHNASHGSVCRVGLSLCRVLVWLNAESHVFVRASMIGRCEFLAGASRRT